MKFWFSGLLVLLFATAPFAQTFINKGKFGITVGDKIEAVEFIENERKLLLVGNYTATIWDIERNELIEKVVFGKNDELNFAALNSTKTTVLSAETLVRASADAIRSASIYDVRTGRRVYEFDRRVSGGFWSKNNRTLVTSDRLDLKSAYNLGGEPTEISFWDGETFAHRSSIRFEKLFNVYLTADGARLYVHSADAAKTVKFEIFNALTGALETTLFTSGSTQVLRSAPIYSSSGRFVGAVITDRAAGDARSLSIWETDGSGKPWREISSNPSLSSSEFLFSTDEKFVAVDSGKKIQIIDLNTSKRTALVDNSALPLFWIAGNEVFLYGETGVRVNDAKSAYRYETIYETVEDELPGGTKETRVVDYSSRIPSPDGNMFLTFSNDKLTILDARSGKVLNYLVEKPGSREKGVLGKLRKVVQFMDRQVLVRKSNWSRDGKFVYAIDGDYGTATLWRVQ